MMGLVTSLVMILVASAIAMGSSSSVSGGGRALDGLLQDYAYQAFLGPRTRTGVVYDGAVPSNLTGIRVSAMRLRSGSLRTRGVSMYKEFVIPKGVVLEQPYVERLVLVYHNLGNWSMTYYPLPGYTYLAPVLGLVAYDASDLMATNLPERHIQASRQQPISIKFSELKRRVPKAKCVLFDLNGSVNLSDVLSDNTCTTFQQGHFSIVVEQGGPNSNSKKIKKVWIIIIIIIVGSVFALLVMLGVVWVGKYRQRKRMHQMERAADAGEALHMTAVGSTKAPAATGTRTQPTLETEY